MDHQTTNVLVAGVGGQGVILASDIMCEVFMGAGYDVKKSEIHGMAMRGGIVTSHFRFGKKVYSPLIKEGEVDILFAFGPHLFHFLPRAVRIEKLHRLSSLLCIFAQIFLIHHAVVIHDEGHDAR
jgi:hypothetical protein